MSFDTLYVDILSDSYIDPESIESIQINDIKQRISVLENNFKSIASELKTLKIFRYAILILNILVLIFTLISDFDFSSIFESHNNKSHI